MLCPGRRLPCRRRRLRRQSRRLDLAYTAQALRRHSLTTVRTHSFLHWLVVMPIFFLLWIVNFLSIIIYQRVAPSIPVSQQNVMRKLKTERNPSRVGKAYTAQARVGTPQKPYTAQATSCNGVGWRRQMRRLDATGHRKTTIKNTAHMTLRLGIKTFQHFLDQLKITISTLRLLI